jgi:hypothetical protein
VGPNEEKGATSSRVGPPGKSLPTAPTERTFFAVAGEVMEPGALSSLPAENTKRSGCAPVRAADASKVSAS